MTVFVEDAVLRDARQRAERLPLSPAEQRRWQEVAAYAAARGPDPNPERAAVLRELLSLPGADDRQVLEAAGRLLSDAVTGGDTVTGGRVADDAGSAERARPVYALCREWFEADVKAAAPLLELFTGHHRDPEGGPLPPDPELVGRLGQWLTQRAGPGARLEDATVIAGGFSRLHARCALDRRARRGADRAGRHVRHRGAPRGVGHADPAGPWLSGARHLVGGA